MGFGTLFIGYFFLLNISNFTYTDIIAGMVVLLGLYKLSSVNKQFFYGAVCAAQGSRGIFATTSDFHPMAKKLLESIDNCVGVNGEKIFMMAIECQYGTRRRGGKYYIDTKIL